MAKIPFFSLHKLAAISALALTAFAVPVSADSLFTKPLNGFQGMVRAGGEQPGAAIYRGGKAVVSGRGLVPGQEITLLRGPKALNDTPILVDDKGEFTFELQLDQDAAVGLQPLVVVAEKPAAASVVELKISPEVPISGAELFKIQSEPVTKGLYQVAYSEAAKAVFVTAAVGRPPVSESKLVKLNPETLAVEAEITPAAAPARANDQDGGLFAVYGVAVDDANGTVWTGNTRQNTIAVYKQSDLSLVKQFAPGSVPHSRDIVIDSAANRAYASTSRGETIEVFDTKTLEQLAPIVVKSQKRGESFGTMSLELDAAANKLFTVSMSTNEAAIIDLNTGEARVIALPGARGASGVAYDPQEGLVFTASQGSDNLLIVKEATGEVIADTPVGAGALNVAFEPVSRLAFVANRSAGTITVVDTSGKIVANLDAGSMPNQLRADGKGNIWAVNKSRGQNDEAGDRLWPVGAVLRAVLRPLIAMVTLWLAMTNLACAEIRLRDITGQEVVLQHPAQRIILGEARHLSVLGLIHDDPVSLVAGWRTDKGLDAPTMAAYRARFPAIDAIASVGSGNRDISVENIIAQSPDLVILSLMDQADPAMEIARSRIEALGIPVVYVDFFSHPLENSAPSLRILGALTGAEAKTEEFLQFYESRLNRIRERLADPAIRRPNVFIHVHAAAANCCATVGPGVFDDFITLAGGHNIGRDVVSGVLGNVSLEFLLGADPDFYVATGGTHMATRGGLVLGSGVETQVAADSFASLTGATGFSALRAVEAGHVAGVWHLFNDSPVHVALIEYFAKLLHPDLFTDIDPTATLAEIQSRFSPVQVPGTWWLPELK
jgi:ABC-type Fe3+-hydroxamate transport system substrate-binding protein/DNA-binding beta-propeller fold protein YncE